MTDTLLVSTGVFQGHFCEGDKRDGSVAGGKGGVKGELLKMNLQAAEGGELVVKGNIDTG